MSAAIISPASAPGRPPGSTAVTGTHLPQPLGFARAARSPHRLGDALRAVRVFAGAAFDVIILGQYGEEVGVVRRK